MPGFSRRVRKLSVQRLKDHPLGGFERTLSNPEIPE